MDGGTIVLAESLRSSVAAVIGSRNAEVGLNALIALLKYEDKARAGIFSRRINGFLSESLESIARNWVRMGPQVSKVRRRNLNPKFKIGKKIVYGKVHFINELIWQLQFRSGSTFYYDKPYMRQADAVLFAAKALISIGLEKRLLPPSDIILSEKALLEDSARIVAQKFERSFRKWNCRQLPNLARGAYSSISKNNSSDLKVTAKSQYKVTIHDINRRRRNNTSSVKSVK